MSGKSFAVDLRSIVISVDSYDDGVLCGCIHAPCQEGGIIPFHGTLQMLQEMENCLDELEFPRSFTAVRTFHQCATAPTNPSDGLPHAGKLATFSIRILFRQNVSWQGCVSWLEGKQEQSFRSVLELLLLIAGALDSIQES